MIDLLPLLWAVAASLAIGVAIGGARGKADGLRDDTAHWKKVTRV